MSSAEKCDTRALTLPSVSPTHSAYAAYSAYSACMENGMPIQLWSNTKIDFYRVLAKYMAFPITQKYISMEICSRRMKSVRTD